jgi:hypothetical protein
VSVEDANNKKKLVDFAVVWQDLHDDDKTCMQLSYWELIFENGQ